MVKLVELPEGTNEVPNEPQNEPQPTPEKQVPSSTEQPRVQQDDTSSNEQCAAESQPVQQVQETEQSIPEEGSCKVDMDSEPFVMVPDETIAASDSGDVNPNAQLEPGDLDLIDPLTLEEEAGIKNALTDTLESINHFDTDQPCSAEVPEDQTEVSGADQTNKQVRSEQQCVETDNNIEAEANEVEVGVKEVANEAIGETTNTESAGDQVKNIESENGAVASISSEPAKPTEKSTKEKIMELQEIQSVLDKINADIHNIKDKVDDSKPEKSKADKFEDDFKAIRMRNDALRQELISIKLAQNQRRPVDTSKFTEQKIIENTKLHQLRDSTCTLQNEVELINKARKAQEHLKQVQQERKAAAQKKLREALAAERGPCGVKEIQQSIDTLKSEMELIINAPISDIVPDDENTETITTEDGETKPVNKNKKAHDDMMKKYVLMQVMKNNIKELTKKMNDIMAAEGVTPVTPGETSVTEPPTVDPQQPSTDVKEEGHQDDEYYMHDDEGNDSDLYEEDENEEEEEEHEQNKNILTDIDTNQEYAKQKLSIAESVAKSIATVESVIYKNKSNDEALPSTSNTPATEAEPKPNVHGSGKTAQAKPQKHRRGRKGKAPPENVLAAIRTNQQQQKQQEEMKRAAAAAAAAKKDAEAINTSKIGTYNFLLKLQREMASMQIQMTKMQENLRAANRTLQHVLETEFADM